MADQQLFTELERLLTDKGAAVVGCADLGPLPPEVREGLPLGLCIGTALSPSIVSGIVDGPTEQVLSAFIRERLYTSLMRAGAESLAAEHATRLSAMQAAERNISDNVDELQGRFRHERQEAITNELMDIVAAYQSVLEK